MNNPLSPLFQSGRIGTLATRVHRHGAKIAMQIQHSGKNSAQDMAQGREIWLPSRPKAPPVSDMMAAITRQELSTFVGIGPHKPRMRVMDQADINQMIEWFAAAALRAKQAGFDAVELHGAHNYILAGFLSPYYNQRDDAYGGPLESRARPAASLWWMRLPRPSCARRPGSMPAPIPRRGRIRMRSCGQFEGAKRPAPNKP